MTKGYKSFGKSGTMREVRKNAVCHPERRHHGKGLCSVCSQRYWAAMRAGKAPETSLVAIVEGSDTRESLKRQAARHEKELICANGLTQDRARQLFSYDPETGILLRRVALGNAAPAGEEAGYIDDRGYIRVEVDDRAYRAHQIAWLIVTGEFVDGIDHWDGDKQNNKWTNLREAAHWQNMHNKGKTSLNTSGFKGVSFHAQSGKWRAAITVNGARYSLGLHPTKELAAAAYRAAAFKLVGEFARVA